MASIGAYNFATMSLDGDGAADAAMEMQEITRPGTSGKAYRLTGLREGTSRYRTVADFDSGSSLKSAKDGYVGYQGSIRTLTDGLGNSYTVLVRSVRASAERKAAVSAGGLTSGVYILTAVWEVEAL